MLPTLEVVEFLHSIQPASRDELIQILWSYLSDYDVRVIDTHNTEPVIFIFTGEKKYLIKIELCSEHDSMVKELSWYMNQTTSFFKTPQCVATLSSNYVSGIILEYLEGSQTLDQEVYSKLIPQENVISIWREVLANSEEFFTSSVKQVLTPQQSWQWLHNKYRTRKSAADKFPYLQDLLAKKTFTINGTSYQNIPTLIQKLHQDEQLQNKLVPTDFGHIHGDLHGGNILVLPNRDWRVVDPNGSFPLPYEYDLGKVLHSIHGGYASLITERFSLKVEKDTFIFNVDIPRIYQVMYQTIREQLEEQMLIRSLFMEAFHFVTMLPHHAKKSAETTALFLQAVVLLNQLIKK